jgi:hypothetical protein
VRILRHGRGARAPAQRAIVLAIEKVASEQLTSLRKTPLSDTMKTEISKFCEACLQHLTLLPPALEKAIADLDQASERWVLEKPVATLNDVRARLRSLVDKLASQQAYLLIFGPLKSGKSTLMNAISGAYVSEVTSLPGYPCLVFVRNAQEPHFSVTRYNGRETIFANATVLKDVIEDSHLALAEQIRATELRGDDFDPRTHFTEAIRRVDVKLPVPSLAESSTVLVDTPGLYSRMNFGYDVLTREFRDSAACAVFVVKTDNLFLEQVFTEFNQLLGLFSRIFLVINVDSNKRDLHADGSLQPSAESRAPEQIIEAFKTLSMAGPLRRAYEDQRLRIHAVDLLSAASSFLRGDGHSSNGHDANGSTHPHEERSVSHDAKQREAFAAFLRDLTDYLNSSDYTVEFIRDSLRQGRALCAEAREVLRSEEIVALRAHQTSIEMELTEMNERAEALDRLLGVDWRAVFDQVRAENASRAKASVAAETATLTRKMREALTSWYSTEESLKTLEQKRWTPLLQSAARTQSEETRARLASLLTPPLGGAEPPALVMNDLHTVGFSLAPVAEAAASELKTADDAGGYAFTIKSDELPVRKSFTDWLLFRKVATVRRRLFGEDLAQEIAPELKLKRLPETSRAALEKLIDDTVQSRFPILPEKFAATLLERYVEKFVAQLLQRFREVGEQLREERASLQAPLDAITRIFASQEALQETANRVMSGLHELATKENAVLPDATPDEELETVPDDFALPAMSESAVPDPLPESIVASEESAEPSEEPKFDESPSPSVNA